MSLTSVSDGSFRCAIGAAFVGPPPEIPSNLSGEEFWGPWG